jgi:hypothetical protein
LKEVTSVKHARLFSLVMTLVAIASFVARAKWGTLGFHEA